MKGKFKSSRLLIFKYFGSIWWDFVFKDSIWIKSECFSSNVDAGMVSFSWIPAGRNTAETVGGDTVLPLEPCSDWLSHVWKKECNICLKMSRMLGILDVPDWNSYGTRSGSLRLFFWIPVAPQQQPDDVFHTVSLCVVETVNSTTTAAPLPTTTEWMTDYADILSKFSLRTADIPDEDMCYIQAGQPETIKDCQFNAEAQTFIVIHGWTVLAALFIRFSAWKYQKKILVIRNFEAGNPNRERWPIPHWCCSVKMSVGVIQAGTAEEQFTHPLR